MEIQIVLLFKYESTHNKKYDFLCGAQCGQSRAGDWKYLFCFLQKHSPSKKDMNLSLVLLAGQDKS